MSDSRRDATTQILQELPAGRTNVRERLFPLVYDELHRLASGYMKREPPGGTLQTTVLVHEAYLKLVDQSRVDWKGRSHFLAAGAQAMRRILVDHARRRHAAKRGGGCRRIELADDVAVAAAKQTDVLALEEALEKLASLDPLQADMVTLRFYGGLSVEETAEALGMSKRSLEREWTMVRSWLRRELSGREGSPEA